MRAPIEFCEGVYIRVAAEAQNIQWNVTSSSLNCRGLAINRAGENSNWKSKLKLNETWTNEAHQ